MSLTAGANWKSPFLLPNLTDDALLVCFRVLTSAHIGAKSGDQLPPSPAPTTGGLAGTLSPFYEDRLYGSDSDSISHRLVEIFLLTD